MNKMNLERFIKRAEVIHKKKYNYSESNYTTIKNKILIICNICNFKFQQIPDNHLQGKGCAQCKGIKLSRDRRKNFLLFIKESVLIHGNKYDYSLITNQNYLNKDCKLPIKCNTCQFLFHQSARNHLNNAHGCPKCFHRISKLEIEWLDSLDIIEENRQKTIKLNGKIYNVDAYDWLSNTIYEFYGDYWHGNPKSYIGINTRSKKTFSELYQHTINRENELRIAGFNIVCIWERDWKKSRNNE